jgi:hypothetical protein
LARFRLRFLLQEVDLPQGDTVIGRSTTCQVTLDDPLVSREHARIRIQGDRATIEDLGSRNGVQVQGTPLVGPHELRDGDRLRIGTQELVFSVGVGVEARVRSTRQTGFMCHCAGCGHPYPTELFSCPACGSKDRAEEDTLTGASDKQRDWTLELLIDALRRAQALGRVDDVERILSNGRLGIEQRIASSSYVDRAWLDSIAEIAANVVRERSSAAWGRWLLSIYAALGITPPNSVAQALGGLSPGERATLRTAARRVVESVTARGGPRPEDRPSFEQIEALLSETLEAP